jgi:acetyl esterase/lipase
MDARHLPAGIHVRETAIAGVPLVIAEPSAAPLGAVLHIHGGGWCLGSARDLLPALAALADATGAAVASVEYRLAPEHPHPAAYDDCLRAAHGWLDELQSRHALSCKQLVIAGESAGAHLALLVLLTLRDAGISVAGAALTYGLYDLRNQLPSRRAPNLPGAALNGEVCDYFVSMLLAGQAPDAAVSPLQRPVVDFGGLPPTLFSVGTLDPLLDDSVLMHAHWRQAGNAAWLVRYEEAPHAFDLWPTPEGAHFRALQAAFIRSRIARQG